MLSSSPGLVEKGGVRVCGDAILQKFFNLSYGIAVLQNQAVCGI